MDRGLSGFDGKELVAAEAALFVISICADDPAVGRHVFQIADLELTGGEFPHPWNPQMPEFRARLRSFNIVGLPSGTFAAYTRNGEIFPQRSDDCQEPDW